MGYPASATADTKGKKENCTGCSRGELRTYEGNGKGQRPEKFRTLSWKPKKELVTERGNPGQRRARCQKDKNRPARVAERA